MVYKDNNGNYHLFDWKRSKRVVDAQGNPILTAYNYGKSALKDIADNDYNRYSLQLNIYRQILEDNYNIKIKTMNILILHPDYQDYVHLRIQEMNYYAKFLIHEARNYI